MDGNNRRVCGAVSDQFSKSREQTRVRDHFGHEDCGMVDVEGGCKRERVDSSKGRQEQNEKASRWKECPTHALTGQEISFDS